MLKVSVAVLTVLLLAPPAHAQQGTIDAGSSLTPPRDTRPVRTGTSQIRGRVVAGDTGRPLRRVVVRLTSTELGEPRSAFTDTEGRYQFTDLPAGRYLLTAQRTGYVPLQHGQTRPNQGGRPLQVGEKQLVDRVDFILPRGGVITGMVVDEYGEPVPDVMVMPMRNMFVGGQRRPMPAGGIAFPGSLVTNDIGEFRIAGLASGDYLIVANPRSPMNMVMTEPSNADRTGYGTTYYPGADRVDFAQPITVGVGQTIGGVTVTLNPTRVASVSGVAVGRDGRPVRGGAVTAILEGNTPTTIPMMPLGSQIRPDGSFTINGVPPGQYTLSARTTSAVSGVVFRSGDVTGGVAGGVVSGTGIATFGPAGNMEVLTATVTVAGEDITGIALMPIRFATIAGRVVVDPAASNPPAASALRVSAVPRENFVRVPSGPPPQLNDDFTFELQVAPGDTTFSVFGGTGVQATAVRYSGVDITETGMTVPPGARLEGLEIYVTDRLPFLTGIVTDARGALAIEATVAMFPADPNRWFGPSIVFGRTRPDQDGRYRLRLPRAGEYLAVAVEYLEQERQGDPEYLQRLATVATRVTVGDGETRTLDLRVQDP